MVCIASTWLKALPSLPPHTQCRLAEQTTHGMCRRVTSLHDVQLHVVLLGQGLQGLSVAGMQLGDSLLLARNQGLHAGGTHRGHKGNKPLCRSYASGDQWWD